MRFPTWSVAAVLVALHTGPTSAAADTPGYHVIAKHVLGGEGGWDYLALDGQSRLLYVTHRNQVEVLNADTGRLEAPITGLSGVHGVAFDADRGRAYISNGRSHEISVLDLRTRTIVKTIASSGKNPDSILYDSFSGRVFVFNGGTADATVLDADTDSVIATVALGGKPEFAVTDGHGTIFVNNEDTSEVLAIDAKALAVTRRWSIAPGVEPGGLAFDLKHHRLFSVCDGVLVVSDSEHGRVVASAPVGDGPDGVRYDPATGLVFASNGEGTLTIVKQDSPDTYHVVQTVKTARGARTLELDPKTHHVFVATAEYGPTPPATAEQPHPRPPVLPGSFTVLELAP